MKTLLITFITLVSIVFTKQDEITANATFDGFYDGIYSFTLESEDEDEVGETIEFTEVSDNILEQYDLQSKAFDGKAFTITYTITTEIIETDEDTEEVTTNTLISLKKI